MLVVVLTPRHRQYKCILTGISSSDNIKKIANKIEFTLAVHNLGHSFISTGAYILWTANKKKQASAKIDLY
jgi:hypothetical protein